MPEPAKRMKPLNVYIFHLACGLIGVIWGTIFKDNLVIVFGLPLILALGVVGHLVYIRHKANVAWKKLTAEHH